MADIDSMKDELINRLWLPAVREGGNNFYPKLRKNKKMRLLTLTNDRNFREITKFEGQNLTHPENTFIWTKDSFKKIRLETESTWQVFGGSGNLFEDSILSNFCPLSDRFPLDIINLDFSSQEPDLENGRTEKEIASVERTVFLQNSLNSNGFILIYTTLLDSHAINRDQIVRSSDAIQVNGWVGLNLSGFPQHLTDINQKKSFIENIIKKLCQKYSYSVIVKFSSSLDSIPRSREHLLSIAGIFKR